LHTILKKKKKKKKKKSVTLLKMYSFTHFHHFTTRPIPRSPKVKNIDKLIVLI